MFGLGAGEILIILAFALIFIGPKKLPELARNLGKSIREFQKAKDELLTQVNTEADANASHDSDSDHHKDGENHQIQEEHHSALTGVNSDSTDAEVDAEVKKMEEALAKNPAEEKVTEETQDAPDKKPEGSV
jgi:TatA/E family protein of Tat protein translocase